MQVEEVREILKEARVQVQERKATSGVGENSHGFGATKQVCLCSGKKTRKSLKCHSQEARRATELAKGLSLCIRTRKEVPRFNGSLGNSHNIPHRAIMRLKEAGEP